MYEVKIIVCLKSGIKREGQTNLLTEDEYRRTCELFRNLGEPSFHTLALVISPNVTEYIPTREIEFAGVIGTKQSENPDNS